MIKLLTVIGARPQIIKSSAISRSVREKFSDQVEESILHTGQHYDTNMSQVFFDELGIPAPKFNLGVGSGPHGGQTAKMISGIEDVLLSNHFDGIILYGDTNSTLAGAVAASKLHIPVFHIEAGLRSFNMSMPEEVNRIVCDQLSNICFAPTLTAMKNLAKEGLTDSPASFADGRHRLVVNSGDVMYDNSLFFAKIADQRHNTLRDLNLSDSQYILATIHRDYNTDHPQRLKSILQALKDIASQHNIPIILPLHPRTKAILQREPGITSLCSGFTILPPVSFLEMTSLERHAKLVMTDSGGVQKEAFFFERPCIILRSETEWEEIVSEGAGIVTDADHDKICDAYTLLSERKVHFPQLFGNGDASSVILDSIVNYLNS